MRGFWARVFVALFAPMAIGFIVASAVFSCYAHTPVPSCAQDPTQPWCAGTVHDRRADGGR